MEFCWLYLALTTATAAFTAMTWVLKVGREREDDQRRPVRSTFQEDLKEKRVSRRVVQSGQ